MLKFIKFALCLLLTVIFALNAFTVLALAEQIPTGTVVTFDDDMEYPLERSDAMEIASAPVRDGKSTKALHILGGEYGRGLVLNETTLYGVSSDNYATKNTDPVFSVAVKPETLYRFSCEAYLVGDNEINYLAIYADCNNEFTIHIANHLNETPEEWVKIEIFFKTLENQKVASMSFLFDSNPPEMWFDDFIMEELPAGTIAAVNETYCEEQYNLVSSNKQKNISVSIHNAQSGIYDIQAEQNQLYTFAFTAENLGENSVFLSFDGTNPINGGDDINAFKSETPNRYGYSFNNNGQGKLYLVIDNKDGKLKLSDVQIFKPYYIGTNQSLGYLENPNKKTEEITQTTLKIDNPETPLETFWLDNYIYIITGIAVLVIIVAFAIVFLRKKGGRKNEN